MSKDALVFGVVAGLALVGAVTCWTFLGMLVLRFFL
jgi:hypothetical protein